MRTCSGKPALEGNARKKNLHIYRIYHIYFIYLQKRRNYGGDSSIQEKDNRPERGHFQGSFGHGSTPGYKPEEANRKSARQDSGRIRRQRSLPLYVRKISGRKGEAGEERAQGIYGLAGSG